jgi:polysaccharide deacetylase 2 family uncharacterized protein YibQ
MGLALGSLLSLATGLPTDAGRAADVEALASTPETETAPRADRLRVRAAGRVSGEARAALPAELAEARPRIAIVIDDVGHRRGIFDAANALPAPITFSFLPYAPQSQSMLADLAPGHEAMLHLPMEPFENVEDAGPDMLRTDDPPGLIAATLERNLLRLGGYKGVNNHTGSRFTSDPDAMRVVLADLERRGLFFLDSRTTGRPVARLVAEQGGWTVLERDVFLDDDYASVTVETVLAQLAEAERIALIEGEAIAIGHPYRNTVEAIAQWRETAAARGFDVVAVSALAAPPAKNRALARLR